MIVKWVDSIHRTLNDYRDMVYNAHTLLKDFWSYDEIYHMPLRDVIDNVEFFKPKLQEIARQREAETLKNELTGRGKPKKPGGRK